MVTLEGTLEPWVTAVGLASLLLTAVTLSLALLLPSHRLPAGGVRPPATAVPVVFALPSLTMLLSGLALGTLGATLAGVLGLAASAVLRVRLRRSGSSP